jgi:N-acetylneuraminic acid mutarotase
MIMADSPPVLRGVRIASNAMSKAIGIARTPAFMHNRPMSTVQALHRCSAARPRTRSILAILLLMGACTPPDAPRPPQRTDAGIPPLPLALSNHAVASLRVGDTMRIYTFMGLGAGKTHADIVRAAFEYDSASGAWRRLPDVPVNEGRLASVAAAAGGAVYLFGGYSVAADGHEVSTPDVLRFDPIARAYRRVAPMPTPVDDSVALVLENRWIYLISGWHQDRNLPLVQVYDTVEDRWARATDFPGTPVFGHAGALQGRQLLVCDGVRLDIVSGKRTFSASSECWRGEIARNDRLRIAWRRVAPHPGPPRYRMAAGVDAKHGLLFLGGSENPYNYSGIGYDGHPSPASMRAQAYDPASDQWRELPPLPQASMDHRGLVSIDGRHHFLIGGMRDAQQISAAILPYRTTMD